MGLPPNAVDLRFTAKNFDAGRRYRNQYLVRTSKDVGFRGYRMSIGTTNLESDNHAIGRLAV